MTTVVTFHLLLLVVVSVALRWGGSPERVAAGIFAGAALATDLIRPVGAHRYVAVQTQVLVVDLVMMAGLVWLAVRADRNWPIPLAALHGMTLLGHLGRAENSHLWQLAYYLMVNLPVLPELVILVVGTWLHQRRLALRGTDPSWRASSPEMAARSIRSR